MRDEYNGIEAKKYIVAVVLIKFSFAKFNETKKVIIGGAQNVDTPPRIPEKKPIKIDIIFSYFGLSQFRFNPKKLKDVKIIIANAIIIEIVFKFKLNISFPPISIPKKSVINIGKNLELLIPFLISIWIKFVTITGKHKSIIALVGGKIKAINGTENIDIPIPTDPLTIPPKNTEHKITTKVIISKYSKNIFVL